uniref:HAUS augmin like complex subunit 4 n=1 Tax=Cebus imitator TaxID=2715852 RepID=A0A2K5RU38_CEBIM
MASGDFCSPGEGMEILQQVCSKQLPPCNLSKEDLLQNPYFSKLLLSLSQHVDESGLSLTLAKEQAQAWKEVRLHKTTWLRSEILHRVIQELLVDYYVKMQDTNLTSEDKKFHETLEQRLLVTELTRLVGPSQEREIPSLLGLEKADLLELMPLSEMLTVKL